MRDIDAAMNELANVAQAVTLHAEFGNVERLKIDAERLVTVTQWLQALMEDE